MPRARTNHDQDGGHPIRPVAVRSDRGDENRQQRPSGRKHASVRIDPGKRFEDQGRITLQWEFPAALDHVADLELSDSVRPVVVDDSIDPFSSRCEGRFALDHGSPAEKPVPRRHIGVHLGLMAIGLERASAGEGLLDVHRANAEIPTDSNTRQHALLAKPLEGSSGDMEPSCSIIERKPLVLRVLAGDQG
jgi:hypothetical protein